MEELDKLPGEPYSSRIRARFWITGERGGYVGIGRIELLENIVRYGSISRAAKEMGMSYKKAWKLIDELNQMSDKPLVVKVQGGKQGGGATLTESGDALVKQFRVFEKQLAAFLQQASLEIER
ncbi:winged helix-turn-helix domain-containing protein [Thiomicrorhabdus cannonii]|uniref:winged helix-turn-helix domain-containing protein n=1 Tax=Thiomicrorhabdus cannonii TaxID=2748011 RepID=UPI0015B87234|nr:LysR family transcriptional regulator [Thiomicrorhabdus cannonii]